MAINTDAPHATDALGERAALQSNDFGDTQKLLDISDKELKRELNHSPSDTHLVKCLEVEQNEQTVVNVTSEPHSPSRVSFSRVSSPTPGEQEPCSFMWVAVISCFCPAVPINLFALYFAHMARSMIQVKDYDGARRLGRLALLLSIVSIVVGLAIVLYLLMTEYNWKS
ncbi:tumor suppressor candidate 5-like protein [Labeo rohita]|uniref:Trafficking regulator of GLUT4 1 n=2 Tax=Labeo rohita TaxID=84645 RepID=A0ABQ8LK81_LABRO|nr:trafficking regulator of GLUT4 (SLC2A4) 1b [Labeo rohita]KAI2651080.1 Trafficking regulator of GLUT4 1 [Labeo rohita]RXN14354.1 tumor suppressor candidate 5-like protein [Labeo rohita]